VSIFPSYLTCIEAIPHGFHDTLRRVWSYEPWPYEQIIDVVFMGKP
jgi:hypothetical protein